MPQRLLEEAIVVHNQMVKGPSLLAPLRFDPLSSSEHRFNIEHFLVGFPNNITHIFAGKEIAYDAGSTIAGAAS
jgi:hypothetical protein